VLDSRAPAGRRWRRLSGVDARIDALTLTRAGGAATLWAGTPRGLYRLRGGRVRRFGRADGMRHEHVHALAALGGGTLVAGTARGLVLVRGDRVEAVNVKHGLPVAAVWSIGVARDRTLWLGTSKGLIHFDPRRRRRRRYSVVSGHLPDDWVTAVLVHRAQIYVGTYNAGVARLTRASDGRMTATRLGGGWINISGLLVRGGALYAATMRGLRVRPLAGAGRFRLLRSAAPGRDVTALLDAGSAGLWVGSRRGLALR